MCIIFTSCFELWWFYHFCVCRKDLPLFWSVLLYIHGGSRVMAVARVSAYLMQQSVSMGMIGHAVRQPLRGLLTWAPSQYKGRLSVYGDSHVKDKTVARPSYFYHGDPYTGKAASSYWDGTLVLCHVDKSATHLKIGHPKISSRSPRKSQWLNLNGRQQHIIAARVTYPILVSWSRHEIPVQTWDNPPKVLPRAGIVQPTLYLITDLDGSNLRHTHIVPYREVIKACLLPRKASRAQYGIRYKINSW